MASKDFYFQNERHYEYNDLFVFFDDKKKLIRLRKINDNNIYDPIYGKYPNSGTIIFPNFRADNIIELYSFENEIQGSGTIEYQLSNDNGITFYYVSSSGTWSETTSEFSSQLDVDGNIQYFPLLFPKQIRLKAKLTPPELRTITPELLGVSINYEHNASFVEDLERSIKRFLTQRFIYKNEQRFLIESGVTSYNINLPTGGILSSSSSVYNTQTDPNRQTNLLQSYTSSGVVTIASQLSGVILISYKTTVPIFLASDPDIDESIKNSIIINRVSGDEKREWRSGDDIYEISLSRLEARVRPHPDWEEHSFDLISQHGNHLQTTKITDGLRDLIASKKIIPSIGTGQDYSVNLYSPSFSVNNKLASNVVRVKISGYNDVIRFDRFSNPSGFDLPSEDEYAEINYEDRFDTVPLIKESGIGFNIRNI
jgi:hypothetical protein